MPEPFTLRTSMASLYHSLLLVIAGSTQRELARQVRYLKVENEILRGKLPARITISPQERQRLLKFGARLGAAICQLVTIVTPDTFLRWIREDKKARRRNRPPAQRGRPRTAAEICELILLLARENHWGYARIVGELKKLGVRSIAKNTVRNILRAHGLDPCPKRAGSTWDEFLSRHAASLWQCDFFSQKVLTPQGIREAFLIAFLHVKTRRVVVSPATLYPDEAWVTIQAKHFVQQARGLGLKIRYVQHDRDGKFSAAFDRALERRRVEIVRTPVHAPNCQAYVERFIGSLRTECLNQFVFFGLKHLSSVANCWLEHYHCERPHQGVGNELLVCTPQAGRPQARVPEQTTFRLRDLRCTKRLGGLLKSYTRRAA
jgi:putative transposase